MLEELRKYKDLLSYSEIYTLVEFAYRNNCEFKTDDIIDFFGFAKNKLIPTQILLLDLGIMQKQNDNFKLNENMCWSNLQFDRLKKLMGECFLDYITEKDVDEIVPLYRIKYDIKLGYHIPLSYIKLKYSCIRNFLIAIDLFYLNEKNNILLINPIYNEKLKIVVVKRRRNITIEMLKKRLKLEELHGKEAELFVLNYEMKRLNDSPLKNNIQIISEMDVTAGYDICSYDSKDSVEYDRFIEVKSYSNVVDFYWSKNEISTAKLYKEKYFLYLVNRDKLKDENYTPIIIKNPLKVLESDKYFVEVEKYHIKELFN